MENIKIGKIVNAVGLKGEVKVYNYSDYKERFEELESVLVQKKGAPIRYEIRGVRYQKEMVILKLGGVDDRNGAEAMKEADVLITEEELRVLPEGTFYIRDLIGCCVYDVKDGRLLGKVQDVLQNSAQDIYEIALENGGNALLPAVEEFVKLVDVKAHRIEVRLIPGFVD